MAELEIDQSNLPRVQEVCQCFAVLEDGALAHNLQEQEIEQYYTTNIQKNQLVQNDIRVAKKLQDEEEEQRAQQSALFRQASRQLEEQDFEYARVIQEELQRCAEETQRRELDDEEIAKRMQEEEEQRVRRRSRGLEGHSEGSTRDPPLLSSHQHALSSPHQGEEQYSSTTTTRWQCSTSHNHSGLNGPQTDSLRGVAAQKNTTSWSNQGHTDFIRQIRSELREPLSENSEESDTDFSEELCARFQRMNERLNTAPTRQRASLHQPQERNYRSLCSHSSFPNEFRGWKEEREERDEDYYEYCEQPRRRQRNQDQERNHREEHEGWHRTRDLDPDSRSVEVRERRCSRSESVRLHDRSRHSNRDLARTWSYKDNPDKHVRFQEGTRSSYRQQSESSQVWEMLGHVLRERGVPVRFGSSGAPLQIRPQSRDSQVLHGSEVSYGDSQPHQRAFQRAATTRHSFHGDIRERRRLSYRENGGRDHREDRDKRHDNGEVYEISSRDPFLANKERRHSGRWTEHRHTNNDERGERSANDCRVRRTTSERRHWHKTAEERLSSEEEQEVQRRGERPRRRALQHSQSFSSRGSTRDRSMHMAAGASLQPEPSETSLDLGDLQQVLQDEELARKLQEEEEKLLRRNGQPSPCVYPEGDFRVAQVAQDEEIAHFMQKQEIKSKRRSRELEGPASWREHRAMISHHDRRAARERQVQRERLDSEGLPSPTEDCSPDNQPPSPISTLPQAQQIRNIAEELDPTFQARRQGTDSLRVGQTGPSSQSLPVSHSCVHDFLEEPAFIPPTKRHADKSGRSKPKEKKENCKQQ
ncbi:coiled-coil domain-containing protein 187 isoform X1 [Stegastes partitus]|uniref:Coiled-coil domain-containing protein 50-like n=1 Tax=Stegastes partitus TaxID=144197 RepID=A0A3B5B8Q7_9TELE|nr:PREDICTED: trichohyalin-like isoform X1 [Stegastes partitus]